MEENQTFENFVSKTSNRVVESNQNEARILLNTTYPWNEKYMDLSKRKVHPSSMQILLSNILNLKSKN